MISFKNVEYKIKNNKILDNITFNIKHGEKVLLVGNSGSGKSTIFNLLVKNIYPTSGNIYFNNEDINKYNNKKTQNYRKKHISIIYQKDDLYDNKFVFFVSVLVFVLCIVMMSLYKYVIIRYALVILLLILGYILKNKIKTVILIVRGK